MRTFVVSVIAAASVAVASAQTPAKPAPINITGKWTMSLELGDDHGDADVEFKQDGEKITGTYTGRYGAVPVRGQAQGPRARVRRSR